MDNNNIEAFSVGPEIGGGFEYVTLYSLKLEPLTLLQIEFDDKKIDNVKLQSAGIDADNLVYRVIKRNDGTTKLYRKDGADRWRDRSTNYVIFPRLLHEKVSYRSSQTDIEDLEYRQGMLQIPGVTATREIIQALGLEPIFHDSMGETSPSPILREGSVSQYQQLHSYEPSNCNKVDCPFCNASASLGILQSQQPQQPHPQPQQLQYNSHNCYTSSKSNPVLIAAASMIS